MIKLAHNTDIGSGLLLTDKEPNLIVDPTNLTDGMTTFGRVKEGDNYSPLFKSSTGFHILNNLDLIGPTEEITIWLRTHGVKAIKLGFSHPTSAANKFVGFPSDTINSRGFYAPKLEDSQNFHPLLNSVAPSTTSNGSRRISQYFSGFLNITDRNIQLVVYTDNNLRLTGLWHFSLNTDQFYFCKDPFKPNDRVFESVANNFIGWVVEDLRNPINRNEFEALKARVAKLEGN